MPGFDQLGPPGLRSNGWLPLGHELLERPLRQRHARGDECPTNNGPVPVPVQGIGGGVQAIAAGEKHSCALVNGGVQCWGDNLSGDLGNNSQNQTSVPVAVEGISSGAQGLATGAYHTCALVNGGVQCWGDNAFGELGNNSSAGQSTVPVAVPGLAAGVQALAAKDYHTCALVGGSVQCWGDGTNGDLGDNSATQSDVPVLVSPWAP